MKRKRTPGAVPCSQSAPTQRNPTSPPRSPQKKLQSDRTIVEFMFLVGDVIDGLQKFQLREALWLLDQTPALFKKLSLTLRLRGQLLFEDNEHRRCNEVLLELRRLFPSRIEVSKFVFCLSFRNFKLTGIFLV